MGGKATELEKRLWRAGVELATVGSVMTPLNLALAVPLLKAAAITVVVAAGIRAAT